MQPASRIVAEPHAEPKSLPRSPFRWTIPLAALTCALTPAYTVRWHLAFYPTQLLEVAVVATVLVFVAEWMRSRAALRWPGAITVAAALLLIAGAISVVVAPDRRAALGLYRAYFIEPVLFFFVLVNAVRRVRDALLVLAGLGIAGLVVAIPNAVVVLDAIRHHTLNLATTPPVVIFQTANAVALFLVPLIGVALSLVAYGQRVDGGARVRWVSAGFGLIAVLAVLLSLSRGGYLALAVVVLALALTHRRAKWLVPVVILAGAAVTQVPLIKRRIAYDLHSVQGNTVDWRLHLWRQTLLMMRHHEIFGIGLSNYDRAMGPYWLDLTRVIYPHNILLNFWTVTGLLGVLAFTWILVLALGTAWRGWRAPERTWAPLQLGVFLALLGVVAHGLVDVPYFKNDLSLEFWALLGVSYAGWLWARARPRAGAPTP